MKFFRAMGWLAAITPIMLCGCDVLSGLTFEALPRHTGVVVAGGIEQPVEVYRNAQGVPHIYAKNLRDLAFAQGYVHAQD
ncbi:MAG: penicillin acylase family protein, partial [Candidatus Hydrogenedentes bacterium]|nr:penicillin acylase family protein [Candidatus Hydrogenedentota bacterium]